jgi:hypothetical protein
MCWDSKTGRNSFLYKSTILPPIGALIIWKLTPNVPNESLEIQKFWLFCIAKGNFID